MRTEIYTIGGQTFKVAATFKAAQEVSQIVDPYFALREFAIEENMRSMMLPYQPKWMPSVKNIGPILHIAQKHAGGELTLQMVEELVFEEGYLESAALVVDYLRLIATPQKPIPQDIGDGEKANVPPGE